LIATTLPERGEKADANYGIGVAKGLGLGAVFGDAGRAEETLVPAD
jgi:hypothetical protein